MKIRKKIFHYPISEFLLGIGFVVSFICFFNCINLRHLIRNEQREKTNYKYQSEIQFSYVNQYGETVLDAGLKSNTGNVIIQDIWLYREPAQTVGITDIICAQNEPLSYPVKEGKLPESDEEVEIPTIILGIKLKKQATERGGEYYYTIEERRYRVCAFIGSDKSDLFDYKVILYGKAMERGIWEKINEQGAEGIIGSNQTKAYSVYTEMRESAKEQWEGVGIYALNESDFAVDEKSSGSEMSYYIIILLFCVVNMVLVSEYWIRERYKEVAIRKMFGYTDWKIALFLYKDMIKNAVAAVMAACVVQFFLMLWIEEYLLLYESQFWFYLCISILFVTCLGALMIIYPLLVLRKEDALQQMLKNCS